MGRKPVEWTLERLGKDLLSPGDERLLRCALSPSSQSDLDAALDAWDIDKAPIQSVFLAAYLMKVRPDLSFPESLQPRLRGVLEYCRFKNLKLKAHCNRIAQCLQQEGIPFLFLKGGAMAAYRPDFPRWMSDIDMLVEESRFAQAEALIEGLGYVPSREPHSTDFHLKDEKGGILDLHRFVYMATGRESSINAALFARASRHPVFSSGGWLPSPEDMVFISLVNLCHNLAERTSPGSVVSTFFDLSYLIRLRDSFDWETVRQTALVSGSQEQVYLMARLLDRFVPGLLPPSFLEGDIDRQAAEKKCFHLLYRRFVLAPLRLEIGEFDLKKALHSVRPFGTYVARRARYFFLKRIYPFPALSGRILDRNL